MKSKIMRTIKFRGKNKKTNEWVYGDLVVEEDAMHNVVRAKIITHCFAKSFNGGGFDHYSISTLIDPETIGQFTGLVDKNGKEIYEDDILHLKWNDYDKDFGYVKWNNNGYFYIDDYFGKFPKNTASTIGDFFRHIKKDFEGIELSINGNIHDNPEILKNND